MLAKKFTNDYQIKEYHLDTFGHVNHATYLQILEDIRWDIIGENGFSLEEIHKTKKGPVILDYTIKYKKELKNRDKVIVESYATKATQKILQFHQTILKEDGTIAAEADMTIGFFDLAERKLIRGGESWLQAVGVELE